MKVLVGGRLYDAAETPMVLVLEPEDRANIERMPAGSTQLAVFRAGSLTRAEADELMRQAGERTEGTQ